MAVLRQQFEQLAQEMCAACAAYYGERLVTVAVFGSVGRGTPHPSSDLDLLLVIEKLPAGRLSRVEEFSRVEAMLEPKLRLLSREGVNTSFSPVLKTPGEVLAGSWLFLDMIDDAVLYFDRGGFFQRYLDGLKRRLRALGGYKVQRGERWHWDLKPDYREGEIFDL